MSEERHNDKELKDEKSESSLSTLRLIEHIWNLSSISYKNEIERRKVIQSNSTSLLTATSIFVAGYLLLFFKMIESNDFNFKSIILFGLATLSLCIASLLYSVSIFKDFDKEYLQSPTEIYTEIYERVDECSDETRLYHQMIATLDKVYKSVENENNVKKKYLNNSVLLIKCALLVSVFGVFVSYISSCN